MVIVGNRKDSQSYVGMKRKACAELGIKSFDIDLPEDASEAEIIKNVHELNANPDVHGLSVIINYSFFCSYAAFRTPQLIACYESQTYTH